MWLSGCLTAVVCCALVCFSEVNAQTPKILIETTGTIESESFPYPMKTHERLLWTFNISPSNLVYLNLETVDLDETDELLIFDGIANQTYGLSDVVKKQLYILSPTNSTISVTISGNETKVNRRFRAYYTAKNVGENVLYYSDDYMGLIKSPVYSVQNNIANFSWVVTQQPGKTIYLAFKSLHLTKDGSLTIDDGSAHKNFTGDVLPGDIATATSNVKITVEFSLGDKDQGFELFYSHLYPNCSDHITLVNEQEKTVSFNVIESEIPVQCFVVVEGPQNAVLSAAVNWQELLMSANPTDVILELGDGGSRFSPTILADSPSNRQPAPNVITKTNRLWIGYSYSSSNYSVNASVIINVHNQGEDLVKSGSFGVKQAAPNATLPSNTSAYILSVLPIEQVITYLSANTTLRGDSSISFYDGGKMEKLITKFASGDALYPVISTKNQMMIVAEHFGSNDSFQASFIAAPKGNNQLTTDRFGSYQVNGIANSSNHTWVIATPHNSTELIALNIAKAELSPELILTIYEGPTNSSPVAFTLTNTSIKSSEIHISPGNGASITLQNNGIISTGLIADLSFQIQPVCNSTFEFNSTETYVIKSPDFPSVYPSNAKCEWHFLSEKTLLFSFKSLNLPSTHPLLIYSDNSSDPKLLANVSGNGSIDDIFIAEAHVVVKWSAVNPPNSLTVDKGFEIEVYPLDCSGTFDGSVKEFTTPSYPNVLKNSTLCVWFVNIPPKQGDKAEIVKLSYSSVSVKSSLAQLTVYEGGSLQSGTASNISSTAVTDYLSRTNKLMIKYNYAADAVGGTPYSFKYDLFVCNQLCNNSICLHDSWRCNGINECGDFTDEANCAAAPVIVQESSGVSVTSLVVAILLCLTLGAAGAIAVPLLWRRIRTHGRNYQEFRNSADA